MSVIYFEDLEVWKEARKLTNEIYRVTGNSVFSKDFGLRDQIRRAAVLVMSNVAEGFERGGNQELIQFLFIAKGSCGEARSQLYIAKDQGYIRDEKFNNLFKSFKRLSVMLSNFIKHLKESPLRGSKYKKPPYRTMKEEMDLIQKSLKH